LRLTYKPTVLNISTGIYLLILIIYTIARYDILSSGEGWGIVAMVGLASIGIAAGITDLILQQFLKNKAVLNIIELIIVIGVTVFILRG
jgi:hypothetical protein